MSTLRKQRQVKELKIEGLFDIPSLPADFFSSNWRNLKLSLKELMSMKPMPYGREVLYQSVNRLCMNGFTTSLLSKLLKFLFKYIHSEQVLLSSHTGDFHDFINKYDTHWEKFTVNMDRVLSVFMYLEGEIRTKGEKGILTRVNVRYKDDLVAKKDLYEKLVNSILFLINEERVDEADHMLILKRMVAMIEKLALYHHLFYPRFIATTDEYYKEYAQRLFESIPIADYLLSIQKALRNEQQRIENYLSLASSRESIDKVELRMIKDLAEPIIEKAMRPLIDNSKVTELALLYKLFKNVNLLDILETGFLNVVKEIGLKIVAPESDEKVLVSALLEFMGKIETIMQKSFDNNIKFKYSNRIVFETFINTNKSIGVLISKDLDDNLKKSSKNKDNDQELEARIDGIINIFKLINSKDIFEAFYFKQLAKRTLLDNSKSNDLEISVISKLKAECGGKFISRLHNMQKDIDFSKSFIEAFKSQYTCPIDFHVWNLTGSSWPHATDLKPNFPGLFLDLQSKYTNFYNNNMKKRILSWSSSMSYCEVHCNLKNGNKSLIVSLHQALILLLFNDRDRMTAKEISDFVGLPFLVTSKELLAICMKCKILIKEIKAKEVKENEVITYNPNFTHKFYKITINSMQIKETRLEEQQTIEKVMSERQYIVDAAIVRIMKTRKVMSHTDLLSETFAIVRFNIAAGDVKKRIERLIEQEYMKRDENDRGTYHYIS